MVLIHAASIQSTAIRNVTKIQKLSQGLPTTWEEVQAIDKALNDLGIENKGGVYVAKVRNVDSEGHISVP